MALSANGLAGGGRRGRRRRGRRAPLSEINVTPMVDVMLVLLIIFMVSAPLLTAGVPVDLPKTEAQALNAPTQPLTVSIRRDGRVYVQEDEVGLDGLIARLRAAPGPQDGAGAGASPGAPRPIFVRADGGAPYARVAQVMARLSTHGFTQINLVTDTGGASEGPPEGSARP